MRQRAVDAGLDRASRSSPTDKQPSIAAFGAASSVGAMTDSWERQDGYQCRLAITVSPVSLSSYGGLDGSTVSFSSFILPLIRPPLAVLPTDPRLIVPVFAVSESETLLPLTDPNSTPTSGVATRTELARHADATFESVTGRTKAEVQLPIANQQQLHHPTATARQPHSAAQSEQSDLSQRKRKRDPSPSPARLAAHASTADAAEPPTDDKRRVKQAKLTELVAPVRLTALSPIDELTPRSGRLVSAGRVTRASTSPAAARSRSRERSTSRGRAFDREHNPPVSSLHMPEHTERAWAARKRRLQRQQVEAGLDDEGDDTDTLERLIYPTPFTQLRRQQRRFVVRMTNEKNRMQGQPAQSVGGFRST